MSDFDVKKTKRYQDAVQSRDWETCDLMFDEFEFLQKRIDELESLLREACDLEFKGACYACESVAETNIKLQKRINELEAKIKHW